MNKWLNKQKPITLGFITAIFSFILCYVFSYFTEVVFEQIIVLKFCGAISLLMFFMSWGLFSKLERSMKVFEDIESLYFSAEKAKTREELEPLSSQYNELRKKCQHEGHYYKMNEIWQVIKTKKEFL